MADLDDIEKVLEAIQGIADDISSSMDDVVSGLDDIDNSLDVLNESVESQGGGGGGGAASGGRKGGGGGGGAGRPGSKAMTPSRGKGGKGGGSLSLASIGRMNPVMAAAMATAGVLGKAAGAGAVSAARGGDFTAGFETSLNNSLGKIPFLGEASGLAGGARIEARTTQRLSQSIGQLEAIAGPNALPPGVEEFLIAETAGQERRLEDAQERVRLSVQKHFRDNPGAVGDRSRVSTGDVKDALLFATGQFGHLMEGSGIGQHK